MTLNGDTGEKVRSFKLVHGVRVIAFARGIAYAYKAPDEVSILWQHVTRITYHQSSNRLRLELVDGAVCEFDFQFPRGPFVTDKIEKINLENVLITIADAHWLNKSGNTFDEAVSEMFPLLECKYCGESVPNLKIGRILTVVFFIIRIGFSVESVVACSRCLSRMQRRSMLWNLFTCHILWPVVVIPQVIGWRNSVRGTGHSSEVLRKLKLTLILESSDLQ